MTPSCLYDEIQILRFGQLARFLADQRDEFAGILSPGIQSRINHRTAPRVGDIPFPGDALWEINRLHGTYPLTYPAALATNRVHAECHTVLRRPDRVEPALRLTSAAADAVRLSDHRLVPAAELLAPPDLRLKEQMQVRGVDIAIDEHGLARQHGEGCGHTRLARAAFSADGHKLFHAGAFPGSSFMIRDARCDRAT